jgi:hypothetical protein
MRLSMEGLARPEATRFVERTAKFEIMKRRNFGPGLFLSQLPLSQFELPLSPVTIRRLLRLIGASLPLPLIGQ